MVSKVQPGREALERMVIYRQLAELGPVRDSYARKFALAAFVGILLPLAIFIVYLLFFSHIDLRHDVSGPRGAGARVLRGLPRHHVGAARAARAHRPHGRAAARLHRQPQAARPAGALPRTARAASWRARSTRSRSCTRPSTGSSASPTPTTSPGSTTAAPAKSAWPRKSRAPSATCSPSSSRSSTSTTSRQINDKHGHSAGDAVISHVAALLQLNTRRGDWVSRWGGDEFVVGLHRNRALKMVMERIVKAIAASPARSRPAWRLRVAVSCGVPSTASATARRASSPTPTRRCTPRSSSSRADGKSHVAYRNELANRSPATSASPPPPTERPG